MKWDDELNAELLREWKNISRQFSDYQPLEMNRFIGNRDSSYTMILFGDASKDFIGMVIYQKEQETRKISFTAAHNKLLDKVSRGRTMPVLEFLALEFALQKGLEFYKTFSSCMVPVNIKEILMFTDSSIALNWVRKAEDLESKSQTRSAYLNNHIDKVVKMCKDVHEVKFAHVGTRDNSADFATKVVSPKMLTKSCFLSGPKFLQGNMSEFEWVCVPNQDVNNDPLMPRFSLNKVSVQKVDSLNEVINLDRFSTLSKAVKTLQYVKRFCNNLKDRIQQNGAGISSRQHLDDSYHYCRLQLLQANQRLQLAEIFDYFESKCKVKVRVPELVNRMNIVLDSGDGLLKVKGKMGKLTKVWTPILLSKGSPYTRALIWDFHVKYNHSGTYYLLHKLKQQYFILKVFSAVKEVIGKCFHCNRFDSRPVKVNTNDYKEWLANPPQRFFSHCFVDYFGPYFTMYGKEKVKTYCVIFKCIWSKMVNVEIVTCADANNFLVAFQNHIYSYGLPQRLVSDAGSNLATGFSLVRDSLNSAEVKEFLEQTGIQCCELEQYPKGSLNRGESGVALMKKLIQGSIRNSILDFQHFSHVIKQCICYANKRPLTQQALW